MELMKMSSLLCLLSEKKKNPLEVIRGTILFLEYSCSHETQENFYL